MIFVGRSASLASGSCYSTTLQSTFTFSSPSPATLASLLQFFKSFYASSPLQYLLLRNTFTISLFWSHRCALKSLRARVSIASRENLACAVLYLNNFFLSRPDGRVDHRIGASKQLWFTNAFPPGVTVLPSQRTFPSNERPSMPPVYPGRQSYAQPYPHFVPPTVPASEILTDGTIRD